VTQLPDQLKPWAAELEGLPLELALALAPWIRRLATALGPLRISALADSGAVDGYAGIGRRGSFERLLLSDWLLANELPDEFLRRASQRELAYLQLAYEAPKGSLTCTALFDAGPAQVGAPRLAHLALLVVLMRRAALAGAGFSWGVLQTPGALRDATGADAVRQLLAARTAVPPSPEHLEQWNALEAAQSAASATERWYVGAPASAGQPLPSRARGTRIEIEDRSHAEPPCLAVAVAGSGLTSQTLTLVLPPRAESIRLLRDPYRAPSLAPGTPVIAHVRARSCRFGAGTRRLLMQHADGAVSAYLVPNAPGRQLPRPVVIPLGEAESAVCAQFAKKRLWVVTSDGERLRLRRREGSRSYTLPIAWSDAWPGGPLTLGWHRRVRGKSSLNFTDAADTLYELSASSAGAQPIARLDRVLATLQVDGVLRCLRLEDGGVVEHRDDPQTGRFTACASFATPGKIATRPRVWVALHRGATTVVLLGLPGGLLYYCDTSTSVQVWLPYGAEPCGLLPGPGNPCIVFLERDKHTITTVDALSRETFRQLRATGAVRALWCSATGPLIGYAMEPGEIVVTELTSGEVRLRLTGLVLS